MTSFVVVFAMLSILVFGHAPCLASSSGQALPSSPQKTPASPGTAEMDTVGIEYVGLKDFGDLAALENIPPRMRQQKIAALRSTFAARLRENRILVSDALVLLLEVILLNEDQSARTLARRYGRPGMPNPLQSLMRFKDAKRIAELSAQSDRGGAGVVMRLHPLWWSGPQCRVAISGSQVVEAETPILSPGESFYVQRICDNPADNRLAQGIVPTGKETLYLGFRESLDAAENPQDGILPQNRNVKAAQAKTENTFSSKTSGLSLASRPAESSALRPGGIGVFSGIARARLGSGNQRPSNPADPGAAFIVHGLRFFVSDDWALALQGAKVLVTERSGISVGNDPSEHATAKKSLPVKRFLSRISLEYGRTFGPALTQLRPTLGLGISSLSRRTHSLTQPQYLAPHCGVGLELSSSPFSTDFTLSFRPMVTVAPPPFSGVYAELLLGVTMVL